MWKRGAVGRVVGGCDNSTPETTPTIRETIDARRPVDDDTPRAISFLGIAVGDLDASWLVLRERRGRRRPRVPSMEEIGEFAQSRTLGNDGAYCDGYIT